MAPTPYEQFLFPPPSSLKNLTSSLHIQTRTYTPILGFKDRGNDSVSAGEALGYWIAGVFGLCIIVAIIWHFTGSRVWRRRKSTAPIMQLPVYTPPQTGDQTTNQYLYKISQTRANNTTLDYVQKMGLSTRVQEVQSLRTSRIYGGRSMLANLTRMPQRTIRCGNGVAGTHGEVRQPSCGGAAGAITAPLPAYHGYSHCAGAGTVIAPPPAYYR